MAKKQVGKSIVRKPRYPFLRTLCAVTIIVVCVVMFIGGEQSGVRTVKTIYKCLGVTAVIGIIFKVVIKAVESYEETHGG